MEEVRGRVAQTSPRRTRAQAALFDGITFLMLASISAALIFSFVGSYGTSQDRVLRSAYVLNYMQSVVKASYYVDASTLSRVDDSEVDLRGVTYRLPIYADLRDSTKGCPALSAYAGSNTVSDLLKRDLADVPPAGTDPDSYAPNLDDQFDQAPVMGITAMQCAFKELMKPFSFSGYYYGFDVFKGDNPVPVTQSTLVSQYPYIRRITNFEPFLKQDVGTGSVCETAKTVSQNVVSVRVPFKVVYIQPPASSSALPERKIRDLELLVCIFTPA